MNHLLAYLASWLLGYLILNILFRKNTLPGPGLTLILSAGLGLALSATITFFSYILFDRLNAFIVAITHVIFIFILILEKMPDSTAPKKFFSNFRNLRLNAFLYPLIIVLASTPLIFHANFFPWGGWDAWSCWNLKAKFLFVGGEDWKDLFSPILWRSSPHYPLLLPLINVWGWIGTGSPSHVIPLMTSIIFTFLVAGLTFFGLKIFIKDFYALLAALLMLYLPFFVTLGTSQYCDIVFAYFLLAGFICFVVSHEARNKPFLLLSGLFLGWLSFTKPEGMVAEIILIFLIVSYLFLEKRNSASERRESTVYFLAGIAIGSLPAILFQLLYATSNQTFTNGLLSPSNPSNLYRFKMILAFFWIELFSEKWHGLWLLLMAGLLVSARRCFSRDIVFIPLFLLLYGSTVGFYYWLNTYFEITWWLSVSLNRILFSILPLVIFWVFYALWRDEKIEANKKD